MYFLIDAFYGLHILSDLRVVASQTSEGPESYVFIDASEKSVYFLASSGYKAIDFVIKDKVVIKAVGRLAVSYKKLMRFMLAFKELNLEGCTFEFSLTPGLLEVNFKDKNNYKKAGVRIQTGNHQRVPIPSTYTDTSFIINGISIKSAINKIRFAIDKDHAVMSLRNVYLSLNKEEGFVSFVGTNGVVLSEVKVSTPVDTSCAYLIPLGHLVALSVLSNIDVPVLVGIYDGNIKFKFGGGCYHGVIQKNLSFQEGYEKLLSDYAQVVSISTSDLLPALGALVGVLDKDADPAVTILVTKTDITFKHDTSMFKFEHKSENVEGDPIVHLDANYLLRTVQAHGRSNQINLCLTGNCLPVIIKNVSDSMTHSSIIAPIAKK